MVIGLSWFCYVNYRVTGDPFRLPYQIYEEVYSSGPVFIWGEAGTLGERCRGVFADLREWILERSRKQKTVSGFIETKLPEFRFHLHAYLRFVFLVPLITLPRASRNRWVLLAIITVFLVSTAVSLETSSHPRKLTPIAGLIVLIIVQCMRHLRWIPRQPLGKLVAKGVPVVCVLSVLGSWFPTFHLDPWPPSRLRAHLEESLSKTSTRHLILVRYGENHSPLVEWVHNKADIDLAQVVWAREVAAEKDEKLLKHFKNRTIWILEADTWREAEEFCITPFLDDEAGPYCIDIRDL
jgi:hypothetical protein